MNRRTRLGLNILGAALLLGVLGDALLRATPWGLNVLLWAGALLAGVYVLRGRQGDGAREVDVNWLLTPAVAFAAAFAWRDSPTLRSLDAAAFVTALSLLAWRARGRSARLAGLTDYARACARAVADAVFAALPLVLSDVRWKSVPHHGATRHAASVARGLMIAAPLLLIFGALFMAADAVFAGIVTNSLRVDAGAALSHALLAAGITWSVAGFMRGMLLAGADAGGEAGTKAGREAQPFAAGDVPPYTSVTAEGAKPDATCETRAAAFKSVTDETEADRTAGDGACAADGDTPREGAVDTANEAGSVGGDARADARAGAAARKFSLGAVEMGTALGLLDLLFAAFVVVQVRYFFGGSAHVQATTGLTYAEYARRGFFELVCVASLALPLLLAAHHLLRREDAAARAVFRALAGVQIILLFVIMSSAVARMRLYQSEYGLTELRLYTTAFMLWLGLVCVWFAATVLWRERRELFACGALASAFLVLGALHVFNPDARIVRANAAQARAGRAFDATYAGGLSADAVPALVGALPALPRESRCALAERLLSRWPAHEPSDWRTWNISRARARRAVLANEAQLNAETSCLRESSGGKVTR